MNKRKREEGMTLMAELGRGTFGVVCAIARGDIKQPNVVKLFFNGDEAMQVKHGDAICEQDVHDIPSSVDAHILLWTFLTSMAPEIAARGAICDLLSLTPYLAHVGGNPVWCAVMPEVNPVTHAMYTALNTPGRIRFKDTLQTALGKLHSRGFIHGDIKPSNIAITGGDVTLLDFGLFTAVPRVTGNIAALYAEQFRAPEFYSGDIVTLTTAVDVWASGITLLAFEHGSMIPDDLLLKLRCDMGLTWAENFEALEHHFPFATIEILSAVASMLITDPATRLQFTSTKLQRSTTRNVDIETLLFVMNQRIAYCPVIKVMMTVVAKRLEYTKITHWEANRTITFALDLFVRAQEHAALLLKTPLLMCACLSLASALSNLGGEFLLTFRDFKRCATAPFSNKELLCAVYAVVGALNGRLMPERIDHADVLNASVIY